MNEKDSAQLVELLAKAALDAAYSEAAHGLTGLTIVCHMMNRHGTACPKIEEAARLLVEVREELSSGRMPGSTTAAEAAKAHPDVKEFRLEDLGIRGFPK